jgi:hypothetical protein
VPRYFKEKEDNIEVKVLLKETVDRGGKPKKKGRKKPKKKKGDKGDKPPPEKMTLLK